MTDTTFQRPIECQTMGHANCKKILRGRVGFWRLSHIDHYVYGKLVTENFW